jgi:hypothetical protein
MTASCERRARTRRSGRTWSGRLLVGVVILMVAASTFPVSGAAQESLSKEEIQRFQHRVSEGRRLYELDKFRAALEQFEAAREIFDHPRLTFNIAQSYRALDECTSARAAYERYIDIPEAKAEMRERARRLLSELDETCVETGRLEVTCRPRGASVTLVALDDSAGDDQRSGECPIDTSLRVGRYRVIAEADGFQAQEREVTVELNSNHSIDLSLSPQDDAVFAGLDSHSLIAYSAIGLGAASLVGGFVSDYTAVSRLDELSQAQAEDDHGRVATLQREADSASTRTAVLYSVGAALVVGGATYKWVMSADDGAERDHSAAAPSVSVELAPTGVSTRLRW